MKYAALAAGIFVCALAPALAQQHGDQRPAEKALQPVTDPLKDKAGEVFDNLPGAGAAKFVGRVLTPSSTASSAQSECLGTTNCTKAYTPPAPQPRLPPAPQETAQQQLERKMAEPKGPQLKAAPAPPPAPAPSTGSVLTGGDKGFYEDAIGSAASYGAKKAVEVLKVPAAAAAGAAVFLTPSSTATSAQSECVGTTNCDKPYTPPPRLPPAPDETAQQYLERKMAEPKGPQLTVGGAMGGAAGGGGVSKYVGNRPTLEAAPAPVADDFASQREGIRADGAARYNSVASTYQAKQADYDREQAEIARQQAEAQRLAAEQQARQAEQAAFVQGLLNVTGAVVNTLAASQAYAPAAAPPIPSSIPMATPAPAVQQPAAAPQRTLPPPPGPNATQEQQWRYQMLLAGKDPDAEMRAWQAKNDASKGASCPRKTFHTPDGCHPGHNEKSHAGGCYCG